MCSELDNNTIGKFILFVVIGFKKDIQSNQNEQIKIERSCAFFIMVAMAY